MSDLSAPTNFAATRGFQIIANATASNTPVTIATEATPAMNFNSPISSDGTNTSEIIFAGKNTNNVAATTRIITLSNSTNSWTGDTEVTSAGPFLNGFAATTGQNTTMILRMGANNALPAATNLFLLAPSATASVATLDLGNSTTVGFNETVAGIYAGSDTSGTGQLGVSTITNTGTTAASLTVNNTVPDTFTGNLVGTKLNINHIGSAPLVLTSNSNNFGGLDGTGTTTLGTGTGITVTASHHRQSTLNIGNNSTAVAAVTNLTDTTQSANAVSRISTLNDWHRRAKLDLTNTKLIVAGGSQTGTFTGGAYTGISGLVRTGMGTITGAQPSWNGTGGIVTSQTGRHYQSPYHDRRRMASDVKGISPMHRPLFAGQTVGAFHRLTPLRSMHLQRRRQPRRPRRRRRLLPDR